MLRLFSKEFDADQLSRSPNNCAIMSGAVSSDQQCKLCRKLGLPTSSVAPVSDW